MYRKARGIFYANLTLCYVTIVFMYSVFFGVRRTPCFLACALEVESCGGFLVQLYHFTTPYLPMQVPNSTGLHPPQSAKSAAYGAPPTSARSL